MIEPRSEVYYVGVNDRNKSLFEGLWPLPTDISYNSYLIDDEKVCLIDAVQVDFFAQFIENLHEVLGDWPINYLVMNHIEPDHSGSLGLLKRYYPDIKIIGNRKTFNLMAGFYGIKDQTIEVKRDEVIDLGHRKLKFFMTSTVYWPKIMTTLDETDHILFSGDGFECFGALNNSVLDEEIDTSQAWLEMVRYYSNIVGEYDVPMQNALEKLADQQIDYICPTYGPIWHEKATKVVDLYDQMSKCETGEGIVICYGTMHGNTERMAETIARAASQAGIKNICMYSISKAHHSYILRDIFRYRGLIVGASTYNNGLYREVPELPSEIANHDIKNHYIGWFGSYGWANKTVPTIAGWIDTKLEFEPMGMPVEMKQAMSKDVRSQCEGLGKAMTERLKAGRKWCFQAISINP